MSTSLGDYNQTLWVLTSNYSNLGLSCHASSGAGVTWIVWEDISSSTGLDRGGALSTLTWRPLPDPGSQHTSLHCELELLDRQDTQYPDLTMMCILMVLHLFLGHVEPRGLQSSRVQLASEGTPRAVGGLGGLCSLHACPNSTWGKFQPVEF